MRAPTDKRLQAHRNSSCQRTNERARRFASRHPELVLYGSAASVTRSRGSLLGLGEICRADNVLKESFGQLWRYRSERGARAFFERWKQRLLLAKAGALREVRADDRTKLDGIAAYCKPENKLSLGLVEGSYNKIRVIQRSAYGSRDEDYLMRIV